MFVVCVSLFVFQKNTRNGHENNNNFVNDFLLYFHSFTLTHCQSPRHYSHQWHTPLILDGVPINKRQFHTHYKTNEQFEQ